MLHLNSAIDTKGVRGDRWHRKRETWYRNGNLNCLANHLGVRLLVSTAQKNNPTKLSLLYCAKNDPFRTPAWGHTAATCVAFCTHYPRTKKTSNNQGSEKQTFQLIQNIEASQSMQINNTFLRCESNLFFIFIPAMAAGACTKLPEKRRRTHKPLLGLPVTELEPPSDCFFVMYERRVLASHEGSLSQSHERSWLPTKLWHCIFTQKHHIWRERAHIRQLSSEWWWWWPACFVLPPPKGQMPPKIRKVRT